MRANLPKLSLLLLGLVLAFMFVQPADAAKRPWEKFKYPALGEIKIPDYERVEMANGMVVYLAEDHEFPLIELSATIRAGGLLEPADQVGLASIVGTVLRTGGTQSRTGDEIDELVEARGMRLETFVGRRSGGAYLSALGEDTELGLTLNRPAYLVTFHTQSGELRYADCGNRCDYSGQNLRIPPHSPTPS